MAFYSMTTDAVDAYTGHSIVDWVGSKLVENGWVSMGALLDSSPIMGTATSGSSTTLTDTTKNWTTNELVGKYIWLTSGTGASTSRRQITANTSTQVTVSSWTVTSPAAGTGYSIDNPKTVVYKSSSSINGLPSDFYISVGATSGPMVQFSVFESFNVSTKERDKFAPINSSGYSTGLAVNSDCTLVTTKANTLVNAAAFTNIVGISTGTPLRLIVSPSHVILAKTNGGSSANSNVVYVGAFDSFLSSVRDPMPLVNSSFYTNASSYVAISATTRDPGISIPADKNCILYVPNSNINATDWFRIFGAANSIVAGSNTAIDAGTNPWSAVPNSGSAQRMLLKPSRNFLYVRGVYRDALITMSGVTPGQTMDVNFGSGVVKRYVLVASPGASTGNNPCLWIPDEA